MSIPDNAKLVFKGVIFDVYQWQQKMFDGSMATFEMLKRPATIQVIPTIGETIFLSYEEQPTKSATYTFFGGRAEPNEELLGTAKRELKEETGMESEDWELLKEVHPEGKIDWPMYFYVARNCRKVAGQHLDAGEKIEVMPVSFDEFVEIVSDEKFWGRELTTDVLRMRLEPEKLEAFKKKLFG